MVKGSALISLSMLFGRGSIVLAGVLISSTIGAQAFAAFAFAHITAASVTNIATIGMQNALPRYFARLNTDSSGGTFHEILMAAVLAVSGLILASFIFACLPQELIGMLPPNTKVVLILMLMGVGFNNMAIGAVTGLERFGTVSLATCLQAMVLLIGVAAALYFVRVDFAIWGYILGSLISTVFLSYTIFLAMVRNLPSEGIRIARIHLNSVFSFCGPLFITGILTNSGMWLAGRSLIEESENTYDFAQFAIGLQWFGMASLGSAVLARVVLPRMTRSAFSNDSTEQKRTTLNGIAGAVGFATLFLIIASLFADNIISIYGLEIDTLSSVIFLFLVAAVLESPINILQSLLIARSKLLFYFLATLSWWLVLVVLSYSVNGVVNVAFAVISSYFVFLVSTFVLNMRTGKNADI